MSVGLILILEDDDLNSAHVPNREEEEKRKEGYCTRGHGNVRMTSDAVYKPVNVDVDELQITNLISI